MRAILKILVPSKSLKGDYHTVEVYKDGSMGCNCVGNGYFKVSCWHIKKVKKLLNVRAKKRLTEFTGGQGGKK